MSLTVANVEAELVNRQSARLVYVGYSILTNGSNPNLAGPIRRAYVYTTGLTPASIATVTNTDLANITDSPTYERLCDAAELATLRIVLGQLTDVDAEADDGKLRSSQLMAQILKEIAELEASLQNPTGAFLPAGQMGTATAGAPMPNDPFNPLGKNPTGPWYPGQILFPFP